MYKSYPTAKQENRKQRKGSRNSVFIFNKAVRKAAKKAKKALDKE